MPRASSVFSKPGLGLWLAVLGVLSGVFCLWWRFNAPPGRTGVRFPKDFIYYYLPQTERVMARLRDGEFPLWDPSTCSGSPLFAALQGAALYPPTWLVAWSSPAFALPIRMYIESSLAGLFALALFRAWGLSASASAAGGILFVFGCVLGNSFWPSGLSAIIWFPVILLCIE